MCYVFCCQTDLSVVTIEKLNPLDIIIRKHQLAFASVGVDGKHECSWVLGVVQT